MHSKKTNNVTVTHALGYLMKGYTVLVLMKQKILNNNKTD